MEEINFTSPCCVRSGRDDDRHPAAHNARGAGPARARADRQPRRHRRAALAPARHPGLVYGPFPHGMAQADEHVEIEEYLHIVRMHVLSASTTSRGDRGECVGRCS